MNMPKLVLILALLALLFGALLACGESSQATRVPNSPQSIDQVVLGANTRGADTTSNYNANNQTEAISENLGGNLVTNSWTVEDIKQDCFNFQKAVYTSLLTVHVSDVTVQVNADLVDKYGNKSNGLIGMCELSSATAKNFNWDNLEQDQAWGDYDSTWLLPSLTQ